MATPGRILLANSANPQTDLSGQSGSIVLATFTLKGIAAGTSALTIDASSALLIGSDIALPFVAQNGSMSSSGAASDAEDVPLPPWAFGLMAVGILALGNGSDLTKTGKNGGKHSRV